MPAEPEPQLTAEFGWTLTGPPAGSTAVTVSSSDVHATPKVRESAWVASEVLVPGPRSRGEERDRVADADDLARRACRRTVELIEFVAMDEPVTETDRAPYTVTGPTTTEEFSVRPTFDMVTSSRRIVPAGGSGGCTARDGRGAAGSHECDGIPFADAQRRQRFGVQAHDPPAA